MIKTLLVDGNNLLKIGFHGAKELFHEGKHVGGIYHFLNTLRKFIDDENINKIVVFWDSETNSGPRKLIYPRYKENRLGDTKYKEESFTYQKQRIKQYLEEVFVRQLEVDEVEADDLIAYYCQIAENENKIIFSSDKDLTQLISDKVSVYSPQTKKFHKTGEKIKFSDIEIPHYNIGVFKVFYGDRSDNIDGIYYLGEKNFTKLFPEIFDTKVSISDILTKAELILETEKNNSLLKNILSGKTKTGIYGNEFYEINEKIVDLSNPLITEEGKELVELYYKESLDPEGRGHKNLMKMMMEDGLFKFLPKTDNAWVGFVRPFMKLIRKEKTNHKIKN